jgi:predicted DNA-binding transcriptional regulator YafY
MRASRLLRMLLLLQNSGRMTSRQLAEELEVTPRTILRDVDALTEAGLPVVVFQGNCGGIELAFNYRKRLTGLSADEVEAMSVILSYPVPELKALGLDAAGRRARIKLLESFPDSVRERMGRATRWFQLRESRPVREDARISALAAAIRQRSVVSILNNAPAPRVIHPVALRRQNGRWWVIDKLSPARPIALAQCQEINISSHTFD